MTTDFGPDPRGDISGVDEELCKEHCYEIVKILDRDQTEAETAADLRAYVREYLNPYPEIWIKTNDMLAEHKIISKANLKKVLSLTLEADLSDGHFHDL